MTADQLLIFLAGIVGGALRVGAPFLFVSLGECITEKSGRINLGLEGVLVLSAMAAFGGSWVFVGLFTGAVLLWRARLAITNKPLPSRWLLLAVLVLAAGCASQRVEPPAPPPPAPPPRPSPRPGHRPSAR